MWALLLTAGAGGIWSERFRVGKALSGPLVSTLVCLALANCGVMPHSAPAYPVVNKFLLPLAVPLLLFSADMTRIFRETGRLLWAFAIGAASTVLSTLLAFRLFPLRALGDEAWKVAAALCSRHIGGAVNYVAVSETLATSSDVVAAGLAADNLMCAAYFTFIFWLARDVPPDSAAELEAAGVAGTVEESRTMLVTPTLAALALSALICCGGVRLAAAAGVPGFAIPIVTVLTVALSTALPRAVGGLASHGEGFGAMIMQVFFATVGASGSIAAVLQQAPSLFVFCLIQIAGHLALVLGVGRALGFSRRELLLASNANVGGPTTAAGMAVAKQWRTSFVPALLSGILGYAVATFVSVTVGVLFLRPR